MAVRLLCVVCFTVCLAANQARTAEIPVFNTNDNLAGSLRQAIQDANPAGGDTIVFQIPTTDPGYNPEAGAFLIGLTSGALAINKSVVIDGGGQKITVRRVAAGDFRIFSVGQGTTVTLSRITVANGRATGGSGLINLGNLTIRGCTFTANNAIGTLGGAILNDIGGTLRITNSTFSNNSAVFDGSAIYNDQVASLVLENTTIAGNSCTGASGTEGAGAAVRNDSSGTAVVRNTIVVGNLSTKPAKDVGGNFVSEGYNLIGTTISSTGFGQTGDQLGATLTQANLSGLSDHGGPTFTMRPRPSSVAIDQGKRGVDANNQPIDVDQRGFSRPIDLPGPNAVGGDGSDIGAVETNELQPGPNFTVTNTSNQDDGCSIDDCTLREAIAAANANSDTSAIHFAAHITGVISDDFLFITNPLSVNGPGARRLKISGGNATIFDISTGVSAAMSGLTIADGQAPFQDGGAIRNGGQLTLSDCSVENSIAFHDPTFGGGNGGGIMNMSGATLTLERCTFFGNKAQAFGGGGIFNAGTVTATNCTFFGNSAPSGGAILSVSNNGNSLVTLRNCTIAGNTATASGSSTSGGGGYYGEGAVGNSFHHFSNTILASNFNANNPDLRGYGTSEGNNLIGNLGQGGSGFSHGVNGDKVGVNSRLNFFRNHGGPTDTIDLNADSPAIDAGNDNLAPATDQRGYVRVGASDIGAFELGGIAPSPTPSPSPTPPATPTPAAKLANIATRLRVETNDNVLIGGLIITGSEAKRLILRAIGPSLPNVPGALGNPQLEIYRGDELIAANDNWRDAPNQQEIIDSTVAPANDLESAILTTLAPGAYTAVVSGVGGEAGVGSVEAYDLNLGAASSFANISTRGFVQTGDNVMIGGLIIVGNASRRVILRAIGPSLGIAGQLEDPLLELFDANGSPLVTNNNWKESQQAEIEATTIPPANELESAIVASLPPAAYTAVVRGVNDTTGVALVEAYALD